MTAAEAVAVDANLLQYCVSLSTFVTWCLGNQMCAGWTLVTCHVNIAHTISLSSPKPIRTHHHLAHQAVLNTQFRIYLYRRALARRWTTGCWTTPFDALDVGLRLQRRGYHWRWRERCVSRPGYRLFVAVLAPPAIAALAPAAAETVFAAGD